MDDIALSDYPEQSPETRAERGREALRSYRESRARINNEEAVIAMGDLLSDLMHLAESIGPDVWDEALASGKRHYEAERYGPKCPECNAYMEMETPGRSRAHPLG